jgi:hypothetical protein
VEELKGKKRNKLELFRLWGDVAFIIFNEELKKKKRRETKFSVYDFMLSS